jgi:hypothetical protein
LVFDVGRMQPVPFYGKIAAASRCSFPENRDRFITLDRAFVPSEDCFFLRVAGDSMIGPRHLRPRLRARESLGPRERRRTSSRLASATEATVQDAASIAARRSCSSRRIRMSASS